MLHSDPFLLICCSPFNCHVLTEKTWISVYLHSFIWDVISDPCPNFNDGLSKAPLTFGHGWVFISHYFAWMLLPIHALIPMMTSSNGNIFRVTGHLCGEFTYPDEIPAQRPVTRSFDVFFDLRLNNDWVNNREAGDLRRHPGHYDVIAMRCCFYLIDKNNRFSLIHVSAILTAKTKSYKDLLRFEKCDLPFVYCVRCQPAVMTSSNGNIFRVYWPFVRGIHRSRWIPRTKASDTELWCFL